ncbi:MAG: hypothetical protein IT542_05610 [Rubellimicrobium sp.]|nr:hypothetical protein [Rubellimicrobium sp.]
MRPLVSTPAIALAVPAALAALIAPMAAKAQDHVTFRAPSGNIHCMISVWEEGEARCEIREYTPSFRNRPVWCEGDYGSAFAVGSFGAGEVLCITDTVYDQSSQVLPYGRRIALGGLTCASERSGMTCTNAEGHGFMVSRAVQRVF